MNNMSVESFIGTLVVSCHYTSSDGNEIHQRLALFINRVQNRA